MKLSINIQMSNKRCAETIEIDPPPGKGKPTQICANKKMLNARKPMVKNFLIVHSTVQRFDEKCRAKRTLSQSKYFRARHLFDRIVVLRALSRNSLNYENKLVERTFILSGRVQSSLNAISHENLYLVDEFQILGNPIDFVGIDLVLCANHDIVGMVHFDLAFFRFEDGGDTFGHLHKRTCCSFPIMTRARFGLLVSLFKDVNLDGIPIRICLTEEDDIFASLSGQCAPRLLEGFFLSIDVAHLDGALPSCDE